ncbi:MAG: hypothetical protein KIT84_39110 [Labilithrix sp.]|nr:hypothetical protein [Labilithrix sp.]MCW5817072.1 hypothetical protein [Labilithrix sp.]
MGQRSTWWLARLALVHAALPLACSLTPTDVEGEQEDSTAEAFSWAFKAPPKCACAVPTVEGNSSTCDLCREKVFVRLPSSVELSRVALGANDGLRIEEGVEITTPRASDKGSTPVISNAGAEKTAVDEKARLQGELWSVSAVRIDRNATVSGDVHTADSVLGCRACVRGRIYEREAIPIEVTDWRVTVPKSATKNIVVRSRDDRDLPPGSYKGILAKGGQVAFRSGIYDVEDLIIDDDADVELDDSGGPIIIRVRGRFESDGRWENASGDSSANALVAYLGRSTVKVREGFSGSIVASNAALHLKNKNEPTRGDKHRLHSKKSSKNKKHDKKEFGNDKKHDKKEFGNDKKHDKKEFGNDKKHESMKFVGSYFANRIIVDRDVRIEQAPFQNWKQLYTPLATGEPPPPPGEAPARRPPPPLTATTQSEASTQVAEFIQWAAFSYPEDEELLRTSLANARENDVIVRAFSGAVDDALSKDWDYAMVSLYLLSSLRSPAAESYLTTFVRKPLPSTGHVFEHSIFPDGMPVEAGSLAQLQMIAAIGLSLIDTPTSRSEVLRLVREHPATMVRSEAVRAHLRNGGPTARSQLGTLLAPEEKYWLDRFENRDLNSGSSFDERLATFLSLHPEASQPPMEDAK